MSASSLLRALVIDLESRDQFVLAVAIRQIGERLIVRDGDDDAAEIGILTIDAGDVPTVAVKKGKRAA